MDCRCWDLWVDAAIGLGFIKQNSIFERISRKLEHLFYNKCDRIIVTTNSITDKILERYRDLKSEKFKFIPNGVDVKVFHPTSNEKKNQVIYIGNLGHAYDLEKMVCAFKYIDDKTDIKLLIVGDGDQKEKLVKCIEENNLNNKVILKGYIPRSEIPQLISESIIGIAPLKDIASLEVCCSNKSL